MDEFDLEPDERATAVESATVMIGRFVVAWSRVEQHLRTLELMRTEDGRFRDPLATLDEVDITKTTRFADRLKLVIPKRVGGQRNPQYDWLKETHKVRNLVIHGALHLRRRRAPASPVRSTIIHSDFFATIMAGEGFPRGGKARAPNMRNSLPGATIIDVSRLDSLLEECAEVERSLRARIDSIHVQSRNRKAGTEANHD